LKYVLPDRTKSGKRLRFSQPSTMAGTCPTDEAGCKESNMKCRLVRVLICVPDIESAAAFCEHVLGVSGRNQVLNSHSAASAAATAATMMKKL